MLRAKRLDLDTLRGVVLYRFTDHYIGTWEIFNDHVQADRVYIVRNGTEDWSVVFLDPYKGQILSDPVSLHHYLTDWLVELHYAFLLGVSGTFVAFIFALVLLFLGISGLIIHRRFWAKLFTLRWDKSMSVAMSDIHKVVGIWSAPVLLILGFTGGYWNMAHVLEEASHNHDQVSQPEVIHQSVSLAKLEADAQSRIEGFELTYLVMPFEPGRSIGLFGKVPSSNPINSDYGSGANYSPATGEFEVKWDIRNTTFFAVFIDSFRTLHFGTFAGLTSRIIWAVVGALPLILSITGFWLWYQRRQKRSVARVNRAALVAG